MRAIPQLVSPSNPIPIAEHFRRSHPPCEHSHGQHKITQSEISNGNRTEWSPIRSVMIHCSYHLSSHWLKAYS